METFVKPVLGRTLEECMADGLLETTNPGGYKTFELADSNGIKRGDTVTVKGVTMTALGMIQGRVRYFDPRTAGGKAYCYADSWNKWKAATA